MHLFYKIEDACRASGFRNGCSALRERGDFWRALAAADAAVYSFLFPPIVTAWLPSAPSLEKRKPSSSRAAASFFHPSSLMDNSILHRESKATSGYQDKSSSLTPIHNDYNKSPFLLNEYWISTSNMQCTLMYVPRLAAFIIGYNSRLSLVWTEH